ncbi:MAG: hypothetical protein K2H21_01640, partial [Muribaculaceae bacterium]|nr:hypothetical protein [Muribaculaceae bacterium]
MKQTSTPTSATAPRGSHSSAARPMTSAPSGGGRMHYAYVILICCCLMMGVNVGLSFSCAGIYYTPVSQSLGVPVGEFGIYMSIMYVTS